jgi:transcriptional regulator with XRE-family HTH domain
MKKKPELSARQVAAAKTLRALRESLGVSQRDFASMIGIDWERVMRRESGLAPWTEFELRKARYAFDLWLHGVRCKISAAVGQLRRLHPAEAGAKPLEPSLSCLGVVVAPQPLSPQGAAGLIQSSPAKVSEES